MDLPVVGYEGYSQGLSCDAGVEYDSASSEDSSWSEWEDPEPRPPVVKVISVDSRQIEICR